ncbi:polymeric immunoglobulin receptor-like isoform X2 [Hemibagrus wyckioides]|uniref:polymeric immunoglobulin receptor-like isoform X2 n=1 Tax=Hemibagrus wyckioides TaxID=337641 RepID=UPI00266D04E9|nr:polymeric immunoglobulin receptor-like isoform X2 [Hemibagrus wyckioides]
MKILLIFTLCLISDGGSSKKVTGYSGGGVLIKCKYDTEYRQNKKYFCKDSWQGCFVQIMTTVKNKWANSGRFSLYDDTKSAEFWVMIRELTVQDTGTYKYLVDIPSWPDIHCGSVDLKVQEGSLVSREVTAYAGGGINIKCRYEDEYKDKPKYFCKIRTSQWCFNQVHTKWNSEWSHDGRFSIHDNRSAGYFSVFIRELITEDTGSYRCGVVVSHKLEIYTVVKLNVREGLSYETSISETVHVGGDLSVSCKYPESLRNNPKFLCKKLPTSACSYNISVKESRADVNMGKFSLYDDQAKHILNMTMKNVTEQDSGEYWCGAEAVWPSDEYNIYFMQINLKITGSSASNDRHSAPGSGNSHVDFKDTRGLVASEAGTSTGHSAVQSPSDPNESVYANTMLPTSTRESASTASMAQLPRNLPDSSISTVEKPEESLIYTTVRFHTNATGSDHAAPKMKFKKEEESCEYATVSHGNSYS